MNGLTAASRIPYHGVPLSVLAVRDDKALYTTVPITTHWKTASRVEFSRLKLPSGLSWCPRLSGAGDRQFQPFTPGGIALSTSLRKSAFVIDCDSSSHFTSGLGTLDKVIKPTDDLVRLGKNSLKRSRVHHHRIFWRLLNPSVKRLVLRCHRVVAF